MKIEIGLTVAPRGQVTLNRTLASLRLAGFSLPRVFCDGPVEVPAGYEVTRREPALGGWPNFWLGLTELVARQPAADAYLMVQDDVVFCRNVAHYLTHWKPPRDCGVISLFTPACNNGPTGWHSFEHGYGMAGAQALLFPRDRAFDFLAHPWTVNHRRAAPKSQNYKGDGLHHIDGAVGEWCRLVGRKVYCHSPSLCQHIGEDSVMYPGFAGKRDRRFADTFPGETLDAAQTFVNFSQRLQQWELAGGDRNWAISGALWGQIAVTLRPGMRTLETGSGLSTQLFLDAGCQHTSLEHDHAWVERVSQAFPAAATAVQWRPLKGSPAWYAEADLRGPYDVVLIDGPTGDIGRQGALDHIVPLVHEQSVVFLDDTNRPAEEQLATDLKLRLGWGLKRSRGGTHGYCELRRELPY